MKLEVELDDKVHAQLVQIVGDMSAEEAIAKIVTKDVAQRLVNAFKKRRDQQTMEETEKYADDLRKDFGL